jgi:hypothetical protein
MTSTLKIVDWAHSAGRTYLDVAGITVAVEGDPERDGTLGIGNTWTVDKIQEVVRRFEAEALGLPRVPFPPPAGLTLGALYDRLEALARAVASVAELEETLADARKSRDAHVEARTCAPWRHERVPQLEALVAEARVRVAALRAQPGTP